MLSLGKSCFGTGRSLRLVDHDIVAESVKLEVRIINKILICLCIHAGYEDLVTVTTGDGDVAVCGTGCTCNLNAAVSVSLCRKNLLFNDNLVTYGAMLTLGKTAFGTGGSYCLVNYLGMTGSNNNGILILVTAYTGVKGVSVYGTGRSNHGFDICVSTYGVNALVCERVIATYELVGIALTVVRMICGIEVLEATAGYVNYAENSLSLVNVEKESHTLVKLLSLVVSAVKVNHAAAGCVNGGTAVGNVAAAVDGDNRTVDSGDNLNMLTLAAGDHSTVFFCLDDKLGALTASKNNLDDICIVISGNGEALKVDFNLYALKDDRACKSNICGKVYVVVRTESSLKICLIVNAYGLVYDYLILVIASLTRSYRVKDLALCPIVGSTVQVTECINVAVNIFVTAGAGVGSVALIGTGGKSNCCGMAMALCRNYLLCNESLAAYLTVTTLCKTGFGTGGSLRRINYGIVSESRNDALCYDNLVTYGAMLTLGKTGFGTGGSLRLVNYLGMRKLFNSFCSSAEFFTTYRTLNYFVIRTVSLTGSCNSIFFNSCTCGVTICCNFFCVAMLTDSTGKCLFTNIGAIGSNCDFLRIIMLMLNKLIKPSILRLRGVVVRSDNTVYGYLVANNRLSLHSIISCFATYFIETVDVEGVTLSILNIEVTVLCINNFGNSTCHIVLIGCSSKRTETCCLLECKNRVCNRRNYHAATVIITNVIAVCINVIALCGNVIGHPAILHLRSCVITDNTVNGDCVTCNRLNVHCIVSYRTVCTINTVNKNLIAVLVFNVHITVSSVGNVNDRTGNIVLVRGVIVLGVKCTECKSLLNGKNRICSGRNYCSAVAVAHVVAVCVKVIAFR